MASSLKNKISKLSNVRQKRIQSRANELIAEELTLRDLRKALELTQVTLSKKLNIKQESISRMEHRSDILLSTLSSYIKAMGGNLKLTAEFPDRPPVIINGFNEIKAIEQDPKDPTQKT